MKGVSLSQAMMWLFIAEILALVGVLLPVVGLLGSILSLVALYAAGKLDEGYKKSFILSIVVVVITLVMTLAGSGVFGTLLGIVHKVLTLVILNFVVMTTVKYLDGVGASSVSAKGVSVYKINMICTIVYVVLSVLALIPVIQFLAAILMAILLIVSLVASILYMIFLFKSSKALG